MDNKYNEHEEVGLAKSIYCSNVTLSKVVAQSASEAKEKATFSPHQNPVFALKQKFLGLILISFLQVLSNEALSLS